jgi:hypothetical protein
MRIASRATVPFASIRIPAVLSDVAKNRPLLAGRDDLQPTGVVALCQ